jgi:hypothetical protein
MITRRGFIGALLCLPVAKVERVDPLSLYFDMEKLRATPLTMWGIPYHCNDGVQSNTWLGISREFYA